MSQVAENVPNRFMARAIQLSLQNVLGGQGGPFGAVIVRDGKIIAEGVNRVTANNDPTAHAEVNAIREACARSRAFALPDCDIYASCEPVPCASLQSIGRDCPAFSSATLQRMRPGSASTIHLSIEKLRRHSLTVPSL
jgi:tRNA(Arg) A34 adenosine deaminase TadA